MPLNGARECWVYLAGPTEAFSDSVHWAQSEGLKRESVVVPSALGSNALGAAMARASQSCGCCWIGASLGVALGTEGVFW